MCDVYVHTAPHAYEASGYAGWFWGDTTFSLLYSAVAVVELGVIMYMHKQRDAAESIGMHCSIRSSTRSGVSRWLVAALFLLAFLPCCLPTFAITHTLSLAERHKNTAPTGRRSYTNEARTAQPSSAQLMCVLRGGGAEEEQERGPRWRSEDEGGPIRSVSEREGRADSLASQPSAAEVACTGVRSAAEVACTGALVAPETIVRSHSQPIRAPASNSSGSGKLKRKGKGGRARITRMSRAHSEVTFPSMDSYAYSARSDLGFSLFLDRRCKIVYFIGNAEGTHNLVEAHELLAENGGERFYDAVLTEKGLEECHRLKMEIMATKLPLDFELIVTSPLTRALQTATSALMDLPQQSARNRKTQSRGGCSTSADASTSGPRMRRMAIVATELCRERITGLPCDRRREVSKLKKEFPQVDFSHISDDADVLADRIQENSHLCRMRATRFLQWLCSRPEQRIAVVSHSGFLTHLFSQFGMTKHYNIASKDLRELHRRPLHAEMRGVCLAAHRPFNADEIERGFDWCSKESFASLPNDSQHQHNTKQVALEVAVSRREEEREGFNHLA